MLRKKDVILIAIVILIAGVLALCQRLRAEAGAYLRITVDGVIYGEYPLSENQTIEVYGERGHNRVVISGGAASVTDADCPDGYCMAYAPVSDGGQAIICLPHRMVAEVFAESGAPEADAVSQ